MLKESLKKAVDLAKSGLDKARRLASDHRVKIAQATGIGLVAALGGAPAAVVALSTVIITARPELLGKSDK